MSLREETLLLGEAHPDYCEYALRSQRAGRTVGCLTVGGDPLSPSRLHKGRHDVPNEDALLALDSGDRTLLAVADAHHGHEASHVVLQRLSAATDPLPTNPLALLEAILACGLDEAELEPPPDSQCAFLVAIWDRASGTGFGVSYGDATLLVLSPEWDPVAANQHNNRFVTPFHPESLDPRLASEFVFEAGDGDVVVAFTDGIDGCHYHHPETSIRPQHIASLWDATTGDVEAFARGLVELSLAGVDGNPGGQDNVAIVAAVR